MKPSEIIEKSRINGFSSKTLIEYFEFKKSDDSSIADENLDFRTKIVEDLLSDFTNADIELIRLLFDQELLCELETRRHDNLYQLSFYLFELGNLKDVYRIYTAKFEAKNMDVGATLDASMLYMSHKIDEVIEFVENDNSKKKTELLKILYCLKINPDYENEESYKEYINRYFRGTIEEVDFTKNRIQKKWWQIWK